MADKENSAILKGGAVTFKPKKLSYAYDANGNIETIRKNGVLQETYHYDVLNQLVRADSAAQNKSFVYTYDAGGNILSVKEYAYTTGALGTAVKTVNYGYTDGTWKDLLTSYAGQTITYDGIGNPLSYRDGLSMTWRNGRELASLTKNGVTASYLYDESGLRTKKTVGGVVTNYHVIDGRLYGEYTGSHRLLYMFDEAGTRYSFLYNGSTYYYVFNGQGDVIGITDGYGNMLARYTYDAWGKPLTITDGAGADVSGNASHIANVNPFRYRGYYYDKESGLYYVGSRYYDPQTGRFINADGYVSTGQGLTGNNMFAYCGNDPINRSDPSGLFWKEIGNWFKEVGNAIAGFAKKVANVASKSVSASVEVGAGLGIKKKTAVVNADVTAIGIGTEWGYDAKSRSTYSKDKSSLSVKAEIIDNVGAGADITYSAPTKSTKGKGLCMNPDAKWDGKVGAYAFDAVAGIAIDPPDTDFELSFGLGAYFILGGEFEVSINVSEIIREWDAS